MHIFSRRYGTNLPVFLIKNISNYKVFSNYKTNFENLKTQIRTVLGDANKCLSLHEQRDSVNFLIRK